MEMMLNKIVPEGLPYRHSCEGPDDMVSVRTFMFFNIRSQLRFPHLQPLIWISLKATYYS